MEPIPKCPWWISAKFIIDRVSCPPYKFKVCPDGPEHAYLQAEYMDPDIFTGEMALQKTRKWRLSSHMTQSELVQTALKCALTSAEHRIRESFRYRGELIFGPHFDVEALVELARAGQHDRRTEAKR